MDTPDWKVCKTCGADLRNFNNRKYIEDIQTARGRSPPHRANFPLWWTHVVVYKILKLRHSIS